LDKEQVKTDRKNRKEGVHQTSVDDQFDVHQLESENRNGESYGDENDKDRDYLFRDQRTLDQYKWELVHKYHGPHAKKKPVENPFDLGFVFCQMGLPVAQKKDKKGEEKVKNKIAAEHESKRLILPIGIDRRCHTGQEKQVFLNNDADNGREIDEIIIHFKFCPIKCQRKMENKGGDKSIRGIKQNSWNIGEPILCQTIKPTTDNQGT
jgi:hypothetical protein